MQTLKTHEITNSIITTFDILIIIDWGYHTPASHIIHCFLCFVICSLFILFLFNYLSNMLCVPIVFMFIIRYCYKQTFYSKSLFCNSDTIGYCHYQVRSNKNWVVICFYIIMIRSL